jgi:hypothetical protein
VLMLVAVASLAALLLLGRTDAGSERAFVALLALGAALLVGHLVDLVLPRPQLADGVPRGLVGALLAVLAGAGAAVLAAGVAGDVLDGERSLVHGAVVAGVAALAGLVASYVVVEATADDDPDEAAEEPRFSRWVLPVIQVALPVAACAPLVLALQATL